MLISQFAWTDGYVYELEWNGYIGVSFYDGDDRMWQLPDSDCWYCHPHFMAQCAEHGVKMTTFQDVVDFLNKNDDAMADADCMYWVDGMTHAMSRTFEPADENAIIGHHTWKLRSGIEADAPLWQFRESAAGGNYEGRSSTVLIEVQETPENHRVLHDRAANSACSRTRARWSPGTHGGMSIPDGSNHEFYRVMNYTYQPMLNFMQCHKENHERFFGMEIEVSTKLSPTELQLIVTTVEPVQETFFYMKSDTSVFGCYDNKYEIVTMPMTPRRMKREFSILFEKLENLCALKGIMLSDVFDLGMDLPNGIHIHVNNNAFINSRTSRRRSFHRNRFLTAFNQWDSNFQEWMQKVSKRPAQGRNSEYYPPHPCFDGRTVARRLLAGQRYDEHRSACHDNGNTTEVRVFYGLMNKKHIFSCIELVDAMIDFTREAPISSYKQNRFVPKFSHWLLEQRGLRNAKEVIKACA